MSKGAKKHVRIKVYRNNQKHQSGQKSIKKNEEKYMIKDKTHKQILEWSST